MCPTEKKNDRLARMGVELGPWLIPDMLYWYTGMAEEKQH